MKEVVIGLILSFIVAAYGVIQQEIILTIIGCTMIIISFVFGTGMLLLEKIDEVRY